MSDAPRRKGVSTEPEERARRAGNVDPTGHVSSGIQTGPLRGADERPVASADEAIRDERPGKSPGKQLDPAVRARGGEDITDAYREHVADKERTTDSRE